MNFDYFYNRQSEMYNFIRLPMVLMEDEIFESISIEAKVLYSYMLNRMGLSYKNVKKDADPKYACYCSKVTEDQVIEAVVKHGAKTVKEVNAITGAMKNSLCKENNPLGVCCHKIIQEAIDKGLTMK